jgi:hypothetical protein
MFAAGKTPGRRAPQLEFVGIVSSVSSSALNINTLAGNGRVCFFIDNAVNSNSTVPGQATNIPSNFTLIRSLFISTGTRSQRLNVSWKILNGSEASLTGLGTGNFATTKRAIVFRFISGNIASVSFLPSPTVNGQAISGTLSVQNLSTTGQVAPFINIGIYATDANRNITGLSPRDQTFPGSASNLHVDYDIVNSGTQSATMTGSGASAVHSMMSFTANIS